MAALQDKDARRSGASFLADTDELFESRRPTKLAETPKRNWRTPLSEHAWQPISRRQQAPRRGCSPAAT
jgi:hypothetical protein